jgi:hypothetical protein
LTGLEFEVNRGWTPQQHAHYVVRCRHRPFDAARQAPPRVSLISRPDIVQLEFQVRSCSRLTQKYVSRGHLRVAEPERAAVWINDFTAEQSRLAQAAGAALASVRQIPRGAKRCIQQRLPRCDIEAADRAGYVDSQRSFMRAGCACFPAIR